MIRLRPIPFPAVSVCVSLLLLLSMNTASAETSAFVAAFNVPLTVKENADVGADGFPVSFVAPLPRDGTAALSSIGIEEAPSQIEVLERWPGNNRPRNILVHFQP